MMLENRPEAIGDPGDRFITEAECEKLTSLSKATRWRMSRRGEFPKKVSLSPGRSAYRLKDLTEWMASRGEAA